ncbi:hypothetical protein KGY73_01280 [bacterium]|nr:hypothetical protein [bacterium]
MKKNFVLSMVFILGLVFSLGYGFEENTPVFDEDMLKFFSYRAIGPARQGGRIVDIAVSPQQKNTFYVAAASGGLWKTVNNGTTFQPIFDDQSVISLGDIAVAPSDAGIIWAGTGEANNSRSVYWGNGVYKSTDQGKTWTHMGLKESHHVGRIVIHPQNPDIVYVAALGHLYSFNPERGLYKTTDGGESWEKVLYVNEKTGVVDVAMDPSNPDILYAASYEKQRLPWHFEAGGEGSDIYKSTDAGETWTKLGGGLPGGKIGRIGLDVYPQNPDIVYATVENCNKRPPTKEEAEQDRNQGKEPQKRKIGGEVYRSEDGGKSWKKMNAKDDDIGGHPGYYYGQIRIDPQDDQNIYVLSIVLYHSTDGGKTWGEERPQNLAHSVHADQHALWIDPQNPKHMILGNDGGLCVTYDKGKTWDFYDNLPLAQYYAVGLDMERPYRIYGGLQDNGSWRGPSNSLSGEITLDDWVKVGGGDGFYNQVDPQNSRWLYNESQFGNIQIVDQKMWVRESIRPQKEGENSYRFNWNSPILISPHNSHVIYFGGNVLFRSMNQGDSWQEISPDLTTNDPVKIAGKGNIQYCTITTISESPLTPGLIWVGTDDGKVHVTKDGGANWTDVTKNLQEAGAPGNYWVSRVVSSSHKEGTAYVCKTGYRRDDFRPFLYKTTDYGETWTDISGNLPDESINVVREDRKNPNLLFIGTDMAVYVSIDGGRKWVRMENNMPTNAVHDLRIHPRENDLVVATHGRGLFITDISPLQEINSKILSQDAYLFAIDPQIQWESQKSGGLYGDRHFRAPNDAQGIVVNYYLKNDVEGKIKILITDPYGKEIRTLEGSTNKGFNRVVWDMRMELTKKEKERKKRMLEKYGRLFGRKFGEKVSPGEYLAILEVKGKKMKKKFKILEMPGLRSSH